jgi:hypothetical protein
VRKPRLATDIFLFLFTASVTWLHGAVLDRVLGSSLHSKLPSFHRHLKFTTVYTTAHWCVWLQASVAMWNRSALFWDITQRRVVFISLPKFGTPYRSHVQGSRSHTSWPLKSEQIGCPEMSIQNCPSTLRNIPEDRRCAPTIGSCPTPDIPTLHRHGPFFNINFKIVAPSTFASPEFHVFVLRIFMRFLHYH